MQKVDAKQVKEKMDRNEDFQLINVLPEENFQEKHIPGSVNIPLGLDSFSQRIEGLVRDKGGSVVVYCADTDCNASPKAAKELEKAGFQDVADFEGGVAEWEAAGYALEGKAVGA